MRIANAGRVAKSSTRSKRAGVGVFAGVAASGVRSAAMFAVNSPR
jgi:hypothetical protein